jgi:hypothetical protein
MYKLFEWNKYKQKPGRPIRWHYWPISIGWCRGSCNAFICWHGWPMDGTSMWPNAIGKDHGWTMHLGALKVYFGKRNRKST